MPVSIIFTAQDRAVLQSIAKLETKIITLDQKLKGVGTTGTKSGKKLKSSFGPKALGMFRSLAGAAGIGSVVGALALVNRAHETWLRNIREISTETNKASGDIIAFAALQAGGTKAERVKQAAGLAVRFGISDRGTAFDTVQAIQSVLPGADTDKKFRRSLKISETVFRATQLGISLEDAREAEIAGISQGAEPGAFTRKAFVAGQASGRTPADLIKASFGVKFFKDKDLGFAVASVLAGDFPAEQLRTFTKRAGQGLSDVGGTADFFENIRGLNRLIKPFGDLIGARPAFDTKSELGRLRTLRFFGLDTPEKLNKIGVSELRQQEAISGIVRNLPQVEKNLQTIREQAVPGLLTAQRAAIETELPLTKGTRGIDILKAQFAESTANSPLATDAQRVEQRQLINAIVLRNLGIESGFGFDFIEGEGQNARTDRFDLAQALLFSDLTAVRFEREEDRVIQLLKAENAALIKSAIQLRIEATQSKLRSLGESPLLEDLSSETSAGRQEQFQKMLDALLAIRENTAKSGGGGTLGRVDDDPGGGNRG